MILHNSEFSATIGDIFSREIKELSTINCNQNSGLIEFFQDNSELVNKVGTAFSAARFTVIRCCCSTGAQ